jgi:hypothetical protein
MKNVRMMYCLTAAILVLMTAQGFSLIDIKDGAIHNINYAINDNVRVDWLEPTKATTVNLLSGGIINGTLEANNKAILNIAGGQVTKIVNGVATQATISSGTVGSWYGCNVIATNSITMTGGRINYLNDGIGSIIISGGSIGTLDCDGDGGRVNAGLVKLIGTNFAINGTSLGYGQYSNISGTLTGILANGNALNTAISIDGPASITLVPEPTTLCLFALAGLLIRNKK